MGKPDSNRNNAQYYGCRIHYFILSDEGRLAFLEPYEGDLFRDQTSRRHHNGIVLYFLKSSHSLIMQSRGNCAHGFSADAISHQAHSYQISSLTEFCRKW